MEHECSVDFHQDRRAINREIIIVIHRTVKQLTILEYRQA